MTDIQAIRDAIVTSNVLCPACGAPPGDGCDQRRPHSVRYGEQFRMVEQMRAEGYEPLLRQVCPTCEAPAWYPCPGAVQDPRVWHIERQDAATREAEAPRRGFDTERFDEGEDG